MVENMENAGTTRQTGYKQQTLSNFLVSALDMEDEISGSIYKDYMDRKYWPANLRPDVLENIRQYLNVLIEDTQNHRKIILGLMQKYDQDKQPE